MKRVLLIDNDLSRAKTAAMLRNDCQCVCDECEDVLPLREAHNALNGVSLASNRCREPIRPEWSSGRITPEGFDVILLHTSNDYSKSYFEKLQGPHLVVMFSGHKNGSWGHKDNREVAVNPGKHLLVSREELQEYICDFVHEYRQSLPPPWEVFEGRSAPGRVRERLFASVVLSDATVEGGTLPVFEGDLSDPEYLSSVLTRVFPDEAADLRGKAEAILSGDDRTRGRIHQALKGFVQPSAGTLTASGGVPPAHNDKAIDELLHLLCTQKR